jgi:hypothetical protein
MEITAFLRVQILSFLKLCLVYIPLVGSSYIDFRLAYLQGYRVDFGCIQ